MTEQNKTTTIPLPVQGKDMDSIMQSLESGVEELFTSNRYQEFLKSALGGRPLRAPADFSAF